MNRLFWLGLFSAATACSPSTQYRRSALVPPAHALAWDGRTAERGTLRLEGAISHTNVDTDLLPQVGDSALLVPETLIEGAAGLAVTRGFEIGVRYAHADYSWAQQNAIGTPPIPGDPSLNGFGPEARGTIRFGRT